MLLPILLCLGLLVGDTTAPRYTVTDLGPLVINVADFEPSINAAGTISAWALIDDTPHACLWTDGKQTNFDGLPEYPHTFAVDLNASGTAVGIARALYDRRFTRAVLWSAGAVRDLGTLGGKYASAAAINAGGAIVGSAETKDGDVHAVRWQLQGNMVTSTDIGTLGTGKYSEAHGINTAGHIVGAGEMTPNGKRHAFLWDGKAMTDLGVLPDGEASNARAINDNGSIVGWSDVNDERHPFLWQQGKMTDLGSLGEEPAVAYGINNHDQIVGWSAINSNTLHAFLYQNGTMYDLNKSIDTSGGWILTEAYRINDSGRIVGKGMLHGHAHLVLLKPVK